MQLFVIGATLCGAAVVSFAAGAGENCTFRADKNAYLERAVRERALIAENTTKLHSRSAFAAAGNKLSADPMLMPRRNFIDPEIFDKLRDSGVQSANLSTDEEFFRRISLDLTGRTPSAAEVREFVNDPTEGKREIVIDKLLNSSEFVDKWTMWLGDLLSNTVSTTNVSRQLQGRNAFHAWMKDAIATGKSLKQITWEVIKADGNNYLASDGASNYILAGRQTMGPTQDWYDLMLYQATDRFLGISHYDCLLCHDGRRHLDELSLWGKSLTRMDAQKMAAFFSRINLTTNGNRESPYFNSFTVSDRSTGSYALGTSVGNRPNRPYVGTIRALDPEYRDGSKPQGAYWRYDFARLVTEDPLFAINFANRLWKAMFNYGLVEPVNALDPARLDPDNPPPAPWQLQASHPRLLRALAYNLAGSDFNLREFLRLLTSSAAYQLSSRYEGDWNISQVPLFARHYPRRLEGEEVHDAIAKATNVFNNYTVTEWPDPVKWAMQLPDPQEPRSNGTVAAFMNTFLRGNRDTMLRNQSGSVLQQLYMMNDSFVTNRNKVNASSTLRTIAQMTNNEAMLEELYLTFLGRKPTEYERSQALPVLAKATTQATRNTAVEDIAWVLMNKVEFLFSY